MLLLSFVWFLVIIVELVNGTSPLLLSLGTVLWALFVFYFGLRLAIVPHRVVFLKRNWLFVLAILVPILRFFPFLQRLALARALTATFGMQVIWMFASADQGLRSLRRTMGRRGTGYALTFTMLVILAGAAGMLHFENDSADPQGIHSYPKAVWWVAMQLTNIRVPAGGPWRARPLFRHFHLRRCNIRLSYRGLCRIFYRAGCGGSQIRDS
jgi:voltage-gated potassium channel